MNNFGLGLILNFTDNATRGIQRATRSFQDLQSTTSEFSQANGVDSALMSISAACGIVGDELTQVGQSITSMFTSVIGKITKTGTAVATARSQLSTLYKSEEAGYQKLEQIKDYAKVSIFNFEDLIPSVIMLKANGIEAFDQIASSAYEASNGTEGARQTLMDYAADLAAFKPQMKNAYGTGVQAAMGALNEYIAEGNAMSLKRGASLDINALLGEDTAGTMKERSRQVADLIEQLGMVGMTANLAGTPMQRLSNVSDIFFNLMTMVSDSGVFEKYSELIAKFTDYLFAIPDDELKQIAEVISGALVDLMSPLSHIIDLGIRVVDWLRETVKTNPELVQTTIKTIAMVGAFSLLSGVVLKLASNLGFLRISMQGLFGAKTLMGGAGLLGLLKNLGKFVLPLIAAVTLLKMAWDRNFLEIQETTANTLQKVWDTIKLVFDAFTDNTLSVENFEKAKQMGILPLIEVILQLKYHWGFFVQGFKAGLDAFFKSLGSILVRLGILDVDVSGFSDLIVALFEKMTQPGMTKKWEELGKLLGESTGWLLLMVAVLSSLIKALNLVWGVCKGIWYIISFIKGILGKILYTINLIKGVVTIVKNAASWVKFLVQYFWQTNSVILRLRGLFSGLGSKILQFFPKLLGGLKTVVVAILTGIGNVVIAILGAMGIVVTLPAWVVGLIVVAIAALVALVVIFWDEIKAFFIRVGTAIGDFFVSVWNKISQNPVVQFIVSVITTVIGVIKSLISNIIAVISGFAQMVWSILKGIFNVVKSVVMGIWQIIKSVVNLIVQIVRVIYEVIRVIVLSIILVVQTIWDAIKTGCEFVYNIFAIVFGRIYSNIISPVVEAISTAWNWLSTNVFSPVGEFIMGIFDAISSKVKVVGDLFKSIFGSVRDFLCEAFQKVSDFVTPILDAISAAIQWIADAITAVIDGAASFFVGIGDAISGFGDGLADTVGLATGGYVKTEGMAMLHPNEVVVNDTLTRGLGSFLSDYNSAKFTSSPLIKQDIVATDDYKEDNNPTTVTPPPIDIDGDKDNPKPENSPMRSLINNSVANTNNVNNDSNDDNSEVDSSVTFESGSIVIQVNSDGGKISDEELNSMAERLMKIIGRKSQLRNLQTRKV